MSLISSPRAGWLWEDLDDNLNALLSPITPRPMLPHPAPLSPYALPLPFSSNRPFCFACPLSRPDPRPAPPQGEGLVPEPPHQTEERPEQRPGEAGVLLSVRSLRHLQHPAAAGAGPDAVGAQGPRLLGTDPRLVGLACQPQGHLLG